MFLSAMYYPSGATQRYPALLPPLPYYTTLYLRGGCNTTINAILTTYLYGSREIFTDEHNETPNIDVGRRDSVHSYRPERHMPV